MNHRDALLVATLLVIAVLGSLLAREHRRRRHLSSDPDRRILFPFDESTYSPRALDVTLQLARSENATLVPAYLAVVPMRLPLDAAIPRQVRIGVPLLDEIDERASRFAVRIEIRIEPGRTYRHALARLFERESFDQLVVAAGSSDQRGFGSDDVAWILDNTETQLLVLKAMSGETLPTMHSRAL